LKTRVEDQDPSSHALLIIGDKKSGTKIFFLAIVEIRLGAVDAEAKLVWCTCVYINVPWISLTTAS
jgi:hypothetical protein